MPPDDQSPLPVPEGKWWHAPLAMLGFVFFVAALILWLLGSQ